MYHQHLPRSLSPLTGALRELKVADDLAPGSLVEKLSV